MSSPIFFFVEIITFIFWKVQKWIYIDLSRKKFTFHFTTLHILNMVLEFKCLAYGMNVFQIDVKNQYIWDWQVA
jgi:hypothetical protein